MIDLSFEDEVNSINSLILLFSEKIASSTVSRIKSCINAAFFSKDFALILRPNLKESAFDPGKKIVDAFSPPVIED